MGVSNMVVTRSKGMTLAIRILSLLVLPVFTLIIIASIDFIISSKNSVEMTKWIFASVFFLLFFIVNMHLTIKAYKRNPTVLKIDRDKLLLYLSQSVLSKDLVIMSIVVLQPLQLN